MKKKPFARQLKRVRKICLSLPGTTEKISHGEPTFFTKKRVFAMFSNNHHHDEASASNQHRWWEIDIVYYEIRLLEMLGLATHVVRPRFERHAERVQEDTANRATQDRAA